MDGFFTPPALASFAGAVAAVSLTTQLIKNSLGRVSTQLVSYAAALLVLSAGTSLLPNMGWRDYVLNILNAVPVALASNGAYSAARRMGQGKTEGGGGLDA